MQRMPAVSRPAWALALTGAAGRPGAPRKNPIEIVATMGSYVTRTQAAEFTGLRTGPFGRWADGVNAMREDCATFARHWEAHNDQVAAEDGPLWVVLGDSAAQGLGAPTPYGAGVQLPQIPAGAALVTCGVGVNDILYTSPSKLFADLRALIAALPGNAVLLDLPRPSGCWGFVGRASVPYVNRINRTIHQAAAARGLPVAAVSAHFTPPWGGKFASDRFHPSQDGYRDWARALLTAVP
jgi:acyl-CoA thioesterase-1